MSEILIRIRTGTDDPYEDDYDVSLSHEEVTIGQLLKNMSDQQLQSLGLVRITTNPKEFISKISQTILKQHGWVHVSTAKNLNERKELEQKFWLLDNHDRSPYAVIPKFKELDPSSLDYNTLEQLANGASIVQKVATKSVLCDKDYKKYLSVLRQKKVRSEAAKKSAEKKAEKRKLKEIENAKKVLLKAGELKE